jgi:hypothetical protein
LFRLKRRQSIDLMKRKELKRHAIGNAYVVDRSDIVRFLRKRCKPGRAEAERQQRVIDTLAEFRQQVLEPGGIRIPIRGLKQTMLETTIAGLPAGIELAPGRLTITFEEMNELLQKLFQLAQAIRNDLEGFDAKVSPAQKRKKEGVEYVRASW